MHLSPRIPVVRAALLGAAVAAAVAGSAPAQSGRGLELQAFYGPRGDPNVYCSGGCATGICCIVTPLAPNP